MTTQDAMQVLADAMQMYAKGSTTMMTITTSYAQSCLKITDVPVGHLASVYGSDQLIYRFSANEWMWFGDTKGQIHHVNAFVHRVHHVFKNLNVS